MNITQHKIIAIIGTDTGVGKTYITVRLLKKLNQLGLKTFGLKPIASGGFYQNDKLVNHDGLLLQQAASEYYVSHYRTPSNLAVVFFDILSLNTNRIEAMILRLLHTISLMAFVTTSRPCRTIECCG